uniref:Uncharacterized protein n=1 Tax=Amphimedon queenslandica TaxID=400682 RepID=A0A1X7VFS0_AMPQE
MMVERAQTSKCKSASSMPSSILGQGS